jgi:hypothetical protein
MMTLLFALFVVLYAMGKADLSRAEALKNSVQWAFHIAGSGKTKDTGVFDQQKGGGETLAPAPLLNAQQGQMLEFIREMSPEYEEIAGQSLEVVQTDDTVAMSAPLTAFFPRDQVGPVPQAMQTWLEKVVVGSLSFSSDIRVHIDTPDVVIARSPAGRPVTSLDLCIERLKTRCATIWCRRPGARWPRTRAGRSATGSRPAACGSRSRTRRSANAERWPASVLRRRHSLAGGASRRPRMVFWIIDVPS